MTPDIITITWGAATLTRFGMTNRGAYKWRCNTCGRQGYGEKLIPSRWADGCGRGHSECPSCSRQLTLTQDGFPRVHGRCPKRDPELAQKWDSAKIRLRQTRQELVDAEHDATLDLAFPETMPWPGEEL